MRTLEVSLSQPNRKKILTRNDLINELESILSDIKQRHQFASLRSFCLDAFCSTNNPYLKRINLGDLATNPSEVLRDASQVDRKELAQLVEAMHLLSIKSDHSINLLKESFKQIENKAEQVQSVLQDILKSLPNSNCRVPPEDANVALLRSALGKLSRSEVFSKIKSQLIEKFWDTNASSCSHLSKMSWSELIETPPSAIFDLPNFGKSRFKHLLKAIEKASGESSDISVVVEPSRSDPVLTAQRDITSAINDLKLNSSEFAVISSQIFKECNPQALLTAYLSQSTIQRRIGQLLKVTESRISQLLNEAENSISDLFSQRAPTQLHKLEVILSSAACSETYLCKELGVLGCSPACLDMIRVIVSCLGAKRPKLKNKELNAHWTKSNKFEEITLGIISKLPLSTTELSALILESIPECSVNEILAILQPSAYFLRSKNFWYRDQESALYQTLKDENRPLSSQEITDIFETGPRQMRYLLQNSKNILRIGKNNGRRYTIVE